MSALCEAILLAEINALVANEHLHTDEWQCPDPVEHEVIIDRPDRSLQLVIGVCTAHQVLIAAHTKGYQRSLRKHVPAT